MQCLLTAIVSQSAMFRTTVSSRLSAEPGIEIANALRIPASLTQTTNGRRADVVILHAIASPSDAATVVQDIKTSLPTLRVLVIGGERADAGILSCIEAGADAYLPDDAPYAELVGAVRGVRSNSLVRFPPSLLAQLLRRVDELDAGMPESDGDERLSCRERQVASLIDKGLTDKEIARRLSITLPTAKCHVHKVMRKLNVKRRHQVQRWAELVGIHERPPGDDGGFTDRAGRVTPYQHRVQE